MKRITALLFCIGLTLFCVSATPAENKGKIAIVSFKTCVEESKLGKQELAKLKEMEKQLQTSIEEKEKAINEMAPKFSEEYLDTLTPEAEAKLKEEYKNLNQEFQQLQGQSYNMLGQLQQHAVQKLSDVVTKTAANVAKQKGYDAAFNQEACFYFAPELDISKLVIAEMDAEFEKEAKATAK